MVPLKNRCLKMSSEMEDKRRDGRGYGSAFRIKSRREGRGEKGGEREEGRSIFLSNRFRVENFEIWNKRVIRR